MDITLFQEKIKEEFNLKKIPVKKFQKCLKEAEEVVGRSTDAGYIENYEEQVLSNMIIIWRGATGQKSKKEEEAPKEQTRLHKLLKALNFVSVAQKKVGLVKEQFCRIENGFIIASNEVLTVGHPVEEADFECFPHTMKLIEALARVDDSFSLEFDVPSALRVLGPTFNIQVPCTSKDNLPLLLPDPQEAPITDQVGEALATLAPLVNENGSQASYAAVLLQANTAVATNGSVLIEIWHGCNLPMGMLIPKQAAVAVSKANAVLTGFGFGGSSATFYFDDGSFIKTQLYKEHYVNYLQTFNGFESLQWEELNQEALKTATLIEPFCNKNVFFSNGIISSEPEGRGTSYKLSEDSEFNSEFGISFKNLKLISKIVERISVSENRLFFLGNNLRGAVSTVNCED